MAVYKSLCEFEFTPHDEAFILNTFCSRVEKLANPSSTRLIPVINVVTKTLNKFLRRRYTPKDVCLKMVKFRNRFIKFTTFLSNPGIEYDAKTNRVTASEKYLERYCYGESCEYVKFRLNGMPEYYTLCVLFEEIGLHDVDFGWLLVQVEGD